MLGQHLSFHLAGIFFCFESHRGMALFCAFSKGRIRYYRDLICRKPSRNRVNVGDERKKRRKTSRKGKGRYREHDFIPNQGYLVAL